MRTIGNIVWLLTVGLLSFLTWIIAGTLMSITIIGIPIGIQCFKFAILSLWPFGKDVCIRYGIGSSFLNILWFILGGFFLWFEYVIAGIILSITIIGIPWAKQSFKLAKLALHPFGSTIVDYDLYHSHFYDNY